MRYEDLKSPPALKSVGPIELFNYPISASERLENHYFIPFHYRRWFTSNFRNLSDLDVRAVGLELYFVSQDLAPVGTLPTDELLLAKLVDLPLEAWRSLSKRAIGPLYKWERCLCDNGEIRLYHPVVLEMAQAALSSRERHEGRREGDRERKRMKALPALMIRAGCSPDLVENNMPLLVQVDQCLLTHFDGRRRHPDIVAEAVKIVMRGEA